MSDLIYCFVDIETDGTTLGANSMLSFAAVAYGEDGQELDTFARNLRPLPGTTPDPVQAKWWKTQPAAWAEITRNAGDPAMVMRDFAAWVRKLPGKAAFVASPLIFDGPWIDWYLRKFTDATICDPFRPGALFVGTCVDVPTYVQTAMNLPYGTARKDYPAALLKGINHTHIPIDDARGHATLYFNTRQAKK